MKYFASIAILLFTSLSAFAADPSPLHWYAITITDTPNSKTFTGSSSLDASQLATRVNGSDLIKLENLREVFSRSSDVPIAWHPADEPKSVFILPRTVLFYSELSGDPAAGKQ